MIDDNNVFPRYNLWNDSWIGLERLDGSYEQLGIGQVLTSAQEFKGLHDSSPLVVVGTHRLLVAVLQAALQPRTKQDLEKLWKQGRFPEAAIALFHIQYGERFDLFSPDTPFMQSADIPSKPGKGDTLKTVAYLMPDIPAGTAVTHFKHGAENNHRFCPACAARGLVTVPAFATSGGAGIKPSINGVPPMYILPGGRNLFESLAASLVTAEFQPAAPPGLRDMPWWEREPIVNRGSELGAVGYLHGLTFAARRVRLHPLNDDAPCTRCGSQTEWGVRTMVFEMGESQFDGAPFWQDPFAAYRLPEKDKAGLAPTPIRPAEGKAIWREFSGLFLQPSQQEDGKTKRRGTLRPRVLDQMANLFEDEPDIDGPQTNTRSFRCVGIRTDMKAKVFEWVDYAFEVPLRLLCHKELAGSEVDRAITFSNDCAAVLTNVFRESFNANARKSDRNSRLRVAMVNRFWTALAEPFRRLILTLNPLKPVSSQKTWATTVVQTARLIFHETLEMLPDDAATLRRRVEAEQACSGKLSFRLNKERFDE